MKPSTTQKEHLKEYIIHEFQEGFMKGWIFECVEVERNGLTLLIGKFKGFGKKYTFIKNKKDILLNH